MKRALILTCALLASACDAAPPPAGDTDAVPEAPATPVSASSSPTSEQTMLASVSLPGEYRVAGVDGEALNLPHGVSVSVTPDTITAQSQCITARWSYSVTGDAAIRTQPIPTVACDRGRYPQEEAIFQAFDAARSVSRNRANGIEFSGGRRSVTLFSQ